MIDDKKQREVNKKRKQGFRAESQLHFALTFRQMDLVESSYSLKTNLLFISMHHNPR